MKDWPVKDDPSRDDIAIDEKGRPLPLSPKQVRKVVRDAINRGDILVAIFRTADDQLAVQVFGPPSKELLEILETTAESYRVMLRGM